MLFLYVTFGHRLESSNQQLSRPAVNAGVHHLVHGSLLPILYQLYILRVHQYNRISAIKHPFKLLRHFSSLRPSIRTLGVLLGLS